MAGIPTSEQALKAAHAALDRNVKVGELAIRCIEEFLGSCREIAEQADKDGTPGIAHYLDMFDNAVKLELAFLHGLPPAMKAEVGMRLFTTSLLHEMVALDKLLSEPLSGDDDERQKQKDARKKGVSTFKKSLRAIFGDDFWIPSWLETTIEELLELL